MKKSQKVVGAFALVSVFGVFTRLLSFLFKIYLSRALGAEALGIYQMALSAFFTFASLSSSGIPLVLSRKTAEYNALGKKNSAPIFTSALCLGIIISLVVTILLMIFSKNLGFLFASELAQPIFLIMLPALLSTTIYSIVRGWFWGEKKFLAFSITETIEEALRILFCILFISGIFAALEGIYAIAVAFTASDVIVAIILLCIYFAQGGKVAKPKSLREILLPSIPLTAMRLCSSLITTLVAFVLPLRLVMSGMTGAEATATYGRISGMANPLLFAPNAIISGISIVLVPEMSANMVKNDFFKLNKQLSLSINLSFLISGFFIVAYSSLGSQITELLYKDAISGQYLQIATYFLITMVLTQMTQSALNSIGKELQSFVNFLIGNVFMIVAIIILPKYIGMYSVAVATFLSTLTTAILNVLSLRKATNLEINFLKYAFLVIIFTLPCSFFGKCLFNLISPFNKILGLGIALLLSVGAYVALCLITNVLDIRGIILHKFSPLLHRKKKCLNN